MRPAVSVSALLLACGAACAQPLNDSCATPEAISGFVVVPFDNGLATTDGIANSLCNFFSQQNIDRDLWYVWTPAQAGPTRLTTCAQTSIDTKIAVYEGTACPEGKGIVACSDDNCNTQTTVSWTAIAGRPYLIRIGNYPGAAGGAGAFTIESGIVLGPVVNPSNGRSYYMLSPSTWTAGQAAAVVMGGHLATVRSAEENEFLRASVLGFDGADRRGWIGLNDVGNEGVFTWTSGAPVAFTNWNGGEPNNSNGTEHYAEMFGSNGEWNDNVDFPTFLVFGLVELSGESPCPADLDGDGSVNLQDLATLLAHFGMTSGATHADGDLDDDTDVDLQDLATLLAAFGTSCP